ncbi:unnamed protein product [Somion occarium]|uniref:Uncharacterized protein n=1 Tax=Somion occarium TaxID=3059160 RepID=A0ABP1DIX2_9APHY
MEPALPTKLSEIPQKNIPLKVRVAGRVSSYDVKSATMVLRDEDESVLIDISLCLDPFKSYSWLRETNAPVMVVGYLERVPVSRKTRTKGQLLDSTKDIILRALLVREANDLQFSLWYQAIEERQRLNPASEH